MAAAVSVGFSKDYATIAAGIAAVDAAGTVTVYGQNAAGEYYYAESALAANKAVTVQTDVGGKRVELFCNNGHGFNVSAGGVTINDFIFKWVNYGCYSTHATGTVTVNRCISLGSGGDGVCMGGSFGNGDSIYNNCISTLNRNAIFYCHAGTLTANYCGEYQSATGGLYFMYRDAGTATMNNCVTYRGSSNFGTVGGSNNASSAASGMPNTNPIYNLTDAGFAYNVLTNGNSLRGSIAGFFPVVGGGSALIGAGDATLCPLVTTDIDGRTRSTTASTIGPAEGFTGFSPATPTCSAPSTCAVYDSKTGGAFTFGTSDGEAGAPIHFVKISDGTLYGIGSQSTGLGVGWLAPGTYNKADYGVKSVKAGYNDSTVTPVGVSGTFAITVGLANADVRNGTANYETGGNGSCHVPAAGDVRHGVDVDATTGLAYIPDPDDVRLGVDVEQTTGLVHVPDKDDVRWPEQVDISDTGLCNVPSENDVRFGVDIDHTTGLCKVPATSDVRFPVLVDVMTNGICKVPDASNVRFGEEVDVQPNLGTCVVPSVDDTRDGIPVDVGLAGDCVVPVPADVRQGVPVDISAGVGTLDLPNKNDVRYPVQYDGMTLTGQCVVPSQQDTRYPVPVDVGLSGDCIVPSTVDVRLGTPVDVSGGMGSLDLPAETDVRSPVTYDGATKMGLVIVPAATDVRLNVDVDVSDKGLVVVPDKADVRAGTPVDVQ